MSSNSGSNTLSPFDLSGLGMGFGLYRPRRPSYTFATKYNRQRSESYRYATRKENHESASDVSNGEDFIEGVIRNKTRKGNQAISIAAAPRNDEQASSPMVGMVISDDEQLAPAKVDHDDDPSITELNPLRHSSPFCDRTSDPANNHIHAAIVYSSSEDENVHQSLTNANHKSSTPRETPTGNHYAKAAARKIQRLKSREDSKEQCQPLALTSSSGRPGIKSTGSEHSLSVITSISFNKNLIILCISFILVFSSFRAIQNLQSSINTENNLGIITMMVVHLSMVFACLLAPIIVNIFTAKWGLCIGILCFLIWFGANFHPTFYTLIPTSFFVGFGQGILWNAESSYILKLAFDSSRATRGHLDKEMFRFHGVFLACFQTTHIWGNLISSLLLSEKADEIREALPPPPPPQEHEINTDYEGALLNDSVDMSSSDVTMFTCGALHRCKVPVNIFLNTPPDQKVLSSVLWKLMTSYLVLGVVSFGFIVVLLDKIGARSDPEKTPKQIVVQHLSQLVQHRTLRLLIPLLLFNGMQQGFIYSDYNQYFVTCSLGVHYVGYCMITLGGSTVFGAIFVAIFSNKIPREVVLGFGGIVHIALMIGYLIWIPEPRPVLFFVLAAAWGICDSVWQTQCNTLICLTCTDAPEIAFTNHRLVQSIGLAIMFGSGTWICVSTKLYILMTLLVVAIMFYVLAEYRLRNNEDDVFEDP